MLLRSARLADGRLVDVRLSPADGTIDAVEPSAATPARTPPHTEPTATAEPATEPGPDAELDLDGYLLLPAPAEPHAHLDKALTADLIPNPAGDLHGAIEAYVAHYPDRTVEEIHRRARRAALHNLAHGCTAIRTHVDLNELIGLRSVEALLQLKAELAPVFDLQIVALVGRPLGGDEGATNRRLLAEALDLGVDVGGGCPHIDPNRTTHLELALEAAAERGKPLDLHMDENLDPHSLDLRTLARRVIATGFRHGVVASHCTSLGIQPPELQAEVAAETAAAGISVVTLPQTNLFLQARGIRTAQPRGLTAIAALREAGVNVAAGADNLQDPFNTVGRGDPLETAALLVMAAHLSAEDAYEAISNAARRAMGLPPVTMAPGDPAELLAIRATTAREAVASAPGDRLVFARGRLVARTRTETELTL
ncbi:MAG: amidohydrolase family protein [Acidimicrobiia bacterium]